MKNKTDRAVAAYLKALKDHEQVIRKYTTAGRAVGRLGHAMAMAASRIEQRRTDLWAVVPRRGQLQPEHKEAIGKKIERVEFLPMEWDSSYPAMLMLQFSDGSMLAIEAKGPPMYSPRLGKR